MTRVPRRIIQHLLLLAALGGGDERRRLFYGVVAAAAASASLDRHYPLLRGGRRTLQQHNDGNVEGVIKTTHASTRSTISGIVSLPPSSFDDTTISVRLKTDLGPRNRKAKGPPPPPPGPKDGDHDAPATKSGHKHDPKYFGVPNGHGPPPPPPPPDPRKDVLHDPPPLLPALPHEEQEEHGISIHSTSEKEHGPPPSPPDNDEPDLLPLPAPDEDVIDVPAAAAEAAAAAEMLEGDSAVVKISGPLQELNNNIENSIGVIVQEEPLAPSSSTASSSSSLQNGVGDDDDDDSDHETPPLDDTSPADTAKDENADPGAPIPSYDNNEETPSDEPGDGNDDKDGHDDGDTDENGNNEANQHDDDEDNNDANSQDSDSKGNDNEGNGNDSNHPSSNSEQQPHNNNNDNNNGGAIREKTDDYVDAMRTQKSLDAEERKVRRISFWGIMAAIAAMIFTAWQMAENPDGLFAALCRLCITCVGLVLRLVLTPCKSCLGGPLLGIMGLGHGGHSYQYGHMPVSTMDYGYKDPSLELVQ
jgi:hypothetical protein